MPRILCVWFPLWPIQRIRCARPEVNGRPLALYETTSRGERLTVCSPRAARQGLRAGMSRAEAEVLAEETLLLPADPEGDRATLTELALLCHSRFSPLAALEEGERPECLAIDIEGCAHLFRGERGLVREVLVCFRSGNWRVRCGVADTFGAAWALAHHAERSTTIAFAGQVEALLKPLPVAALRLPVDDLTLLAELGIERIEQLLALPRGDLASRFNPLVTRRLRQALGIEPELLAPVRVLEPIVARWDTEDPIRNPTTIEHLCAQLLETLLSICQTRSVGVLQCHCQMMGSPRSETYTIELVRPSNEHPHLLSLLELQWQRRPFPGAVHRISLEATQTRHHDQRPGMLFDAGHAEDERAAARLLERLNSRLGNECVLEAWPASDAQPEFSVAWRPWLEGRNRAALRKKAVQETMASMPFERPLTLLPPAPLKVWSVVPDGPPQRVEWQQALRAVVRWWGPERIETGWWSRAQSHRDYYRVELETGEWLWIFRSAGQWQLHGLFD